MKTDDFLSDLEQQLSSARPSRRPSASWLAVPAVLTVAVLALLGARPAEREAAPAIAATPVELTNGTCDPVAGQRARETLEGAGYEVTLRELPEPPASPRDLCATKSTVFAATADEKRRISELLGIDDAGGWTEYAPLDGADAPVQVTLGRDSLVPPTGSRIAVFNGTTTVGLALYTAERLARDGFDAESAGNAPEHGLGRTIVAGPAAQAAPVAAALGVEHSDSASLVADERLIAPWAGVIVVLGRDLAP